MAATKTYWWTRADGRYGKVRAASLAAARKKKPGAKIHSKPPYSWLEDEPPRRTSRKRSAKKTTKAPRKRKPTKRKTSRKKPSSRQAAPKRRKVTRTRKPPAKKPAPKPAPKELRSKSDIEADAIAETYVLLAENDIVGYTVAFNPRIKRTLGRTYLRKRVIEYSRKAWPFMHEADRRETVAHEVAHAIAWDESKHRGHGRVWKSVMRRLGYPDAKARMTLRHEADVRAEAQEMLRVIICGKPYALTVDRYFYYQKHGAGAVLCPHDTSRRGKMKLAKQEDREKFAAYLASRMLVNMGTCNCGDH